ncbi:hypothetical protein [Asticcacaulis sp. YBE204]|uniref:hypothetical protein n=1 Tax=Asticcacaulis sp. YBE204 TaxID=1282363 RepID=UPI0003C3DF27|nr:hypothetical protein [Asticcacaulis sp. YBE204]ESQ78490.1 hypothetical protein AEYBE204_13125 [Asticcacaulis sp. YBE204]
MSHASRIADADARREQEEARRDLMAEIEDARAAVVQASADHAKAQREVRRAPPGRKTERIKALLKANEARLKAEGHFGRLMRRAGLK